MSTLLIGVLGYIGSHIASKSKAKSVLGWEPKYSYEDMVKNAWQAFLASQS